MKDLFFPEKKGEDLLYAQLRDEPRRKKYRNYLENMWVEYQSLAPKGFKKNLQNEFYSRWWEMYLAVGLLHLGLNVITSRKDKGPDISLQINGKQIWIEAVAPKVGVKSDRVPDMVINGVRDIPKREFQLRLSQGIDGKLIAFDGYIKNSIIQSDEPCIIAVSACNLDHLGPLLEFPCPAPLTVLAGAGDKHITLDGSEESYLESQESIKRDSNSAVNTIKFEQDDFKIISAVLYSNTDPLNLNTDPINHSDFSPESSFKLFINPRAKNPVPYNFSKLIETWTEKKNETDSIWHKTEPVYIHNK
ncbi:MAG: hypothetical protein JXB48_06125 [Candidatus Latescibacteria bacterium]|nr:hypothetical protein [Candidatus Latescibacterota bacterium]